MFTTRGQYVGWRRVEIAIVVTLFITSSSTFRNFLRQQRQQLFASSRTPLDGPLTRRADNAKCETHLGEKIIRGASQCRATVGKRAATPHTHRAVGAGGTALVSVRATCHGEGDAAAGATGGGVRWPVGPSYRSAHRPFTVATSAPRQPVQHSPDFVNRIYPKTSQNGKYLVHLFSRQRHGPSVARPNLRRPVRPRYVPGTVPPADVCWSVAMHHHGHVARPPLACVCHGRVSRWSCCTVTRDFTLEIRRSPPRVYCAQTRFSSLLAGVGGGPERSVKKFSSRSIFGSSNWNSGWKTEFPVPKSPHVRNG